jgi:hypothetical protein
MVGAFWTDVGNKTFCPEDCSNDVSKAVTLEVLNYEIGDSVKRFGLNVPKRGIFRGGGGSLTFRKAFLSRIFNTLSALLLPPAK